MTLTGGSVGMWLVLAVAHAACPEPEALLDELERLVLEGRFADAEAASERVVAAFGCSPLASPEAVARLWLAEAVLLGARGEGAAADEALAAASRVSPRTWREDYGQSWRARWEAASRRPAPESGRVHVATLSPGYRAAIDGTAMGLPATLPAGLHLLQLGPDDAVAALRFDLPPGLDLVLEPALPALPALPELPAPVSEPAVREAPVRRRRVLHALAVGGAAGLVYGASAVTHAAWDGRATKAQQALNNGLVVGSAGLGATSGALLVRGLATRPAP